MPEKTQSRGACTYCGAVFSKGGMSRHLDTCPQRKAAITSIEQKGGNQETLYHLRVQDAYLSEFWLDLEMPGSRTLKDLDHYLRGIWLECCGHLSEFMAGGWQGKKVPKSRKIEQVFQSEAELTHLYDFGTTSETLIKLAGTREGIPTTKHAIALMARNLMPEVQCIKCELPATHLCMECLIEKDIKGVLCDTHAKTHSHRNYGRPIKLVNSPRLGMCGYTGPAEPPY